MRGDAQNLKWFCNDGIKFEIPFFQRPYVWDETDWKNLLAGINEEADNKMPFIGSVILKKSNNDENDNKYLVIDGQQRLTTLSIMIKAFLDVHTAINQENKSTILGIIYEVDDEPDVPIHIPRITPSNSDAKEFGIVMEDFVNSSKLAECNGKIADAYRFSKSQFEGYSLEQLNIISKRIRTNTKFFIQITIDSSDDEQKIFDSVNSLGKKLTNADIIKNYLYQQFKNKSGSDNASQAQVLRQYTSDWENVFYSETQKEFWSKKIVIGRIETTYMEVFFKDYGILSEIYSPLDKDSFKGIVAAYKAKIDSLDKEGISKLSKSISEYAKAYYSMFHTYEECTNFIISDRFNITMLLLDKMQTSTFYPYILKLVKERPTNYEDQYFALQKFLLKRLCYGLSTKNYNKFCEQLVKASNPIEMMDNYVDFSSVNYKNYPAGLLNIKNSSAMLVLFFIEMIKRNGEEDRHSDLVYSEKMSLEHIMPQSWTTHWLTVPCYEKILDPAGNPQYNQLTNAEDIATHRPTKICSIGNMTILPNKLNSTISNSEFEVKMNGSSVKRKGIKDYATSLLVVKEIEDIFNQNRAWDERNIYEREIELFNVLNSYYHFF